MFPCVFVVGRLGVSEALLSDLISRDRLEAQGVTWICI